MVGRFHGMLYLSAKHSRSLVWWENSIRKAFWRTFQGTDHSVWFTGWVLPYFCERPKRIHQFGKKVLPGLFLGYALYAGRIWKGDIMVADIEELETMDASEIYSKELNAKEVIFPKGKWKIHFSSCRWTNKICWRRSGTENIHLDTGSPNSRRRSKRFSWIIRCTAVTFEPRVKLYSPREESFPVPLKYIDISRTTHTNLDVIRESRTDDHWNIDGSIDLSDSWTGFTQFTNQVRNLQKDICGPERDWQSGKRHPGQIICGQNSGRNWEEMLNWGKKQKWSKEKPKLDNARRLRGIYLIDLEDKESKETIRNAGKKLETPMAPAMPCKTCKKKHGETRRKTDDFKSQFACILEASESTRMRMEESLPIYHEDHIAGKGDNSLQHYN